MNKIKVIIYIYVYFIYEIKKNIFNKEETLEYYEINGTCDKTICLTGRHLESENCL